MRKLTALSKPCLCVNPLVETILILTLSSEVGQSYAIISTTYVMSSTIKTSTWKVLMSYIALVPTKNNPVLVNDFRHISLLNSLTKILVDRLQAVKLKLIHHNQYIFLRGQTIQDCLIWVFEYLHWCCWGLVLKCYELRTRQHKILNVNVLRPSKHYFP
jgi:hypothetical protein